MAALAEAKKAETVLLLRLAAMFVMRWVKKAVKEPVGCRVAHDDRQPNVSAPMKRTAKELSVLRVSHDSSDGAPLLMAASAAESSGTLLGIARLQ